MSELSLYVSCITAVLSAPSAAPTSVRTTSTSSNITVQWEMVPCIHRNGDITGYSVQYGIEGQSTQIISISGGDARTVTIQDLMSSTTYSIQVAAVNSADTGVYSDVRLVQTESMTNSQTYSIFIQSYLFRCISQSERCHHY